jgi:hypothetical protein
MNDLFDQKSVKCPNCTMDFFSYFPKEDKIEVIKKDSDFCKHYAEINPIFYEITVCPKCFFACESKFFENFPVSKIDPQILEVKEDIHKLNFIKKRNEEEALTSFWLAIRIEKNSFKRPFKLANYYMKCGWIERYRDNLEQEDIYSEFSLINYEKLFNNDKMVEKIGKRKISYLLGEINKRLCDFSEAIKWFKIAENECKENDSFSKLILTELKIAEKSKDKKLKCKKKDFRIADDFLDIFSSLYPDNNEKTVLELEKNEGSKKKPTPQKSIDKTNDKDIKKGDLSDGYFSSIRKVLEKEIIFFENDMGNDAYIIKEGIVEIYKRNDKGKKKILTRLKAGEVFGEMAMIASQPRTATAWAVEDTVLLSVKMVDFKRLIDYEREFAIKLISVFRERLLITGREIGRSRSCAKKALQREHLYISTHIMIKSDPKEKKALYKKGELIFSECSSGQVGFIIKKGKVNIIKNLNSPGETILQKLEAGDIFGELALLGDEYRVASAVSASDNTECYVFNKENFISMLRKNNEFALKILKICVERLEKTNEMLFKDI